MQHDSTQEPLTYRSGSLEDKDRLLQLGIDSYGRFADVLGPEHWAQMNGFLQDGERLAELIRKSHVFVCADKARIVGMAYLVPNGNPWDVFEASWSYLRMVGVHPDYAGRGIAKMLTGMCIDCARETGEQVMALHTSEFMDAARHIYETLGFRRVREIAPRFGKKYWLYMLMLNADSQ